MGACGIMNYQVFFFGVFLLFIGFAVGIPFDGSQVPQDCLKSHEGDYLREHEYSKILYIYNNLTYKF